VADGRRATDTGFAAFVIRWAPAYVAVSVTLLLALSVLSLVNSHRINQNTTKIQRGLTRVCERENPVRAEIHLVYDQGPTKIPTVVTRELQGEPALAYLLGLQGTQFQTAQARAKAGVPILDCQPNLTGDHALVLSPKAQDRYVDAYRHHRLDPITGLPRR
jgi:hypothetical protein